MNADDFIKSIGKEKKYNRIKPLSTEELISIIKWLDNELRKLKD